MSFSISFAGDTDEQHNSSAYDRVVERAIVCGRKYASENPSLAREGFKVTVCDYEHDLVLEVSFRPESMEGPLH